MCGCCTGHHTHSRPRSPQGAVAPAGVFAGPRFHQHVGPSPCRAGTLFEEVLSLLRDGPEWRPPEDRCVQRPAVAVCVLGVEVGGGGWRGP